MAYEFGLIAADTTRTRAYLAMMESRGIMPVWTLFLDDGAPATLPGQMADNESGVLADSDWPEANFDLGASLRSWLERLGLTYVVSGSRDVNDPSVVDLIAQCSPEVLVYSGYGGALLREAVLGTGKRFLHIHGGYLPKFKGSTTNFYSLLAEDSIGASAIFLTKEIDSGPIICRERFAPPVDCTKIDHVYDSAARARVLGDALQAWRESGCWLYEQEDNIDGDTYYVIHPVLKHLAILAHL